MLQLRREKPQPPMARRRRNNEWMNELGAISCRESVYSSDSCAGIIKDRDHVWDIC